MSYAISIMLSALAALLGLAGFTVFAQAQPRIDVPAPTPTAIPEGLGLQISSVVTGLCALGYAWINAAAATQKRRAEEAEAKATATLAELTGLRNDLKAVQNDRNLWMRRAYNCGYKSPNEADAS